jgi:SHS family lactate transporter-like MFS transporter
MYIPSVVYLFILLTTATRQTTAITLTLLFHSVGVVLFGVFSDRFGRKWPLVFNLLLVAVLELGAGTISSPHPLFSYTHMH